MQLAIEWPGCRDPQHSSVCWQLLRGGSLCYVVGGLVPLSSCLNQVEHMTQTPSPNRHPAGLKTPPPRGLTLQQAVVGDDDEGVHRLAQRLHC
jgi:hypothetical protein